MTNNAEVGTYRRVIHAIHDHWYDGSPFAIHEVRDHAEVSTSTARRVVDYLVDLGLIVHSDKAFAAKHYRVTRNWLPRVHEVIKTYELAKAMKL